MDETRTVTSHLKHSIANDGVTWNSHCRHNTLGPILPFPVLAMMLDVPEALLGQVLKIPAQNQQTARTKLGFRQGPPRDKTLPQLGGFGAEQEEKPSVQLGRAQPARQS